MTLHVSVYDQTETVTAPQPIVVTSAAFTPGIQASVERGAAPLVVSFEDATSGGTSSSWSWEFSDGGTSSEQDPVHMFALPGTYSVTLTVGVGTVHQTVSEIDLVQVGPLGGLYEQVQSILSPWMGSQYASALATRGTRAAVGSPFGISPPQFVGIVRAFSHELGQGWVREATVSPAELTASDHFGRSVSLWDDLLLVGAPRRTEQTLCCDGAAYLFERDLLGQWSQQAKLLPQRPVLRGEFGASVSLAGDRLIVGAPEGPSFLGQNDGHASIFERQPDGSWSEVATLSNEITGVGGSFGAAVAIEGDWALVSALRHDEPLLDVGRVDVFRRSPDGRWLRHQTLGPGLPKQFLEYGSTLALAGDTAVVGAPRQTVDSIYQQGAVEVFRLGGDGLWRRTQTLTGKDQLLGTRFGAALSLRGDQLLIGAPNGVGGGFVFERSPGGPFQQIAQLQTNDVLLGKQFSLGRTAGLSDGSLLLGSFGLAIEVLTSFELLAPPPGLPLTATGSLQLQARAGPDGSVQLDISGAPVSGVLLVLLFDERLPATADEPLASLPLRADGAGRAQLLLPLSTSSPRAQGPAWAQAYAQHAGSTVLSPRVALPVPSPPSR